MSLIGQSYRNGLREGEDYIKIYDETGNLTYLELINDKGNLYKLIDYYSGGKVKSIQYYENQIVIRQENYDENGMLINTDITPELTDIENIGEGFDEDNNGLIIEEGTEEY